MAYFILLYTVTLAALMDLICKPPYRVYHSTPEPRRKLRGTYTRLAKKDARGLRIVAKVLTVANGEA